MASRQSTGLKRWDFARDNTEPVDTITAEPALAAAARGDKAEFDRQLQRLKAQAKSPRHALGNYLASMAGVTELARASQRTPEHDSPKALAAAFGAARRACLRRVEALPDSGLAWYTLGLSCVAGADTPCAVGAFAVATLLPKDGPHTVMDWTIDVDSHPQRKARLQILQAGGKLLATALGGTTRYTPEVQAIAEQMLPEEEAAQTTEATYLSGSQGGRFYLDLTPRGAPPPADP